MGIHWHRIYDGNIKNAVYHKAAGKHQEYGEKDDSSDHSSIKVNSINVTLIYDNIKAGDARRLAFAFQKVFLGIGTCTGIIRIE